MTFEQLATDYYEAWNRQDVAGILALMHPGAAFYDAFWMEICVGRDLEKYIEDSLVEERYCYERVGDIIVGENGGTVRYKATERSATGNLSVKFRGAEVLIVESARILTVTDFYCSPDNDALLEMSKLAASRHGVPSHTKNGLSAIRAMRIRSRLIEKLDSDSVYLDPDLSLQKLADAVSCTDEHLEQILSRHLNISFDTLLSSRRAQHARHLLVENNGDPNSLPHVAVNAGFGSTFELNEKFFESFGVSPIEFCKTLRENGDTDQPALH